MKIEIKYIFFWLTIFFATFSCKYHTHSTTDGKLKKVNKFRQYPKRSTSYKRVGVNITMDTVENYIVSKTYYKHKVEDIYGSYIIREKTIFYNSKHNITKRTIQQKTKRKTIEYYKNGAKKTIINKKFKLNDSTGIDIIKMKSFNSKGKLIKIKMDTSDVSIRNKF